MSSSRALGSWSLSYLFKLFQKLPRGFQLRMVRLAKKSPRVVMILKTRIEYFNRVPSEGPVTAADLSAEAKVAFRTFFR